MCGGDMSEFIKEKSQVTLNELWKKKEVPKKLSTAPDHDDDVQIIQVENISQNMARTTSIGQGKRKLSLKKSKCGKQLKIEESTTTTHERQLEFHTDNRCDRQLELHTDNRCDRQLELHTDNRCDRQLELHTDNRCDRQLELHTDNRCDRQLELTLTGSVSESSSDKQVPYYLNNFETLLKAVTEDKSYVPLFNSDDRAVISSYHKLSSSAKKLYVRMLCRKFGWIPVKKLNYPEIAADLKPYLLELTTAGLVHSEEDLNELEEVLASLTASDIRTLAKLYHVRPNLSNKKQLLEELMRKCKQNTFMSMFGSKSGGVATVMLARAKKFLQGVYKLSLEPRKLFLRVLLLSSLASTGGHTAETNGQAQLFQMFMVNMGKAVYPSYTIDKLQNIFQGREDVVRLEKALQLEFELLSCTQKGHWDKAFEIFQKVEADWQALEHLEEVHVWNVKLPDFLRSFTASSVLNRLLSLSVETLQRRKQYTQAVSVLKQLLSQSTYNTSHRGYWWERLALNLDVHLKLPLQSLEAVADGLADGHVGVDHRLALYERAEAICGRHKWTDKIKEFSHEPLMEIPKVFIEGRVLHENVSRNGTKFLSSWEGQGQDMVVCGVEELVLEYYKKNGFTSGVHAEGSILSALFMLFFWDIIYMPLPDAFHSPFQMFPLDFYTESFYHRRSLAIESRLSQIESLTVEDLERMAEETWRAQEGCLNWERLQGLDSIKGLVSCMGGKVLSGLLARYARSPRHARSGFPDLTLWNAETCSLKMCEVKGPGDRLSHKQILWLNHMLKLGINAEVCYVKAVAAKKLKSRPS
ncbi:fanconi-associated nuclease 1-like isoform X2 [Physella acuta]|uniref:fanconi-associated nuclease 1-like isoform X2 n=1 Tax=Physella acuta TaxID=109671 RepID=UPI0027DE7E0A|nr:fanconi-associated nuclease 1-like isoform X2 [Physella acuta]